MFVLASRSDVAFVERNGFMRIAPEPKLSTQKCGGCDRAAKGDVGPQSVSDWWTGYQYYLTVIRKSADLGSLPDSPPTVAVIDTGVDYTHIELRGKVLLGKNCVADSMDPLDDNGHGTHLAGIIAAKVNGSYGEGVCDKCMILAVKVLGSNGIGTFFDIAAGMQYARTYTNPSYPPVKIINMAFGGPNSALIAAEVLAIKSAGKLLAASAGDDNTTDTTNAYPGADPNTALRVMATNGVDCRAWFSNFSPSTAPTQYNIAAPGWNIYSTPPIVGFQLMSGTSQACSIVSGVASLVWGRYPSLTATQLVTRLTNYGKSTGCGFPVNTKRVDLRRALLKTTETAIVGGVRDPFTGLPPDRYSHTAVAKLLSDSTVLASDEVNAGGFYEMAGLTAGTGASLSVERSGYISTPLRSNITISSGLVAGPFLDAFPQARTAGNATITLDWKTSQPVALAPGLAKAKLGWELDLYVKTPDGTYVGGDNQGDLLPCPMSRCPGIPPSTFFPWRLLSSRTLRPMASIRYSRTNRSVRVFQSGGITHGPIPRPRFRSTTEVP